MVADIHKRPFAFTRDLLNKARGRNEGGSKQFSYDAIMFGEGGVQCTHVYYRNDLYMRSLIMILMQKGGKTKRMKVKKIIKER